MQRDNDFLRLKILQMISRSLSENWAQAFIVQQAKIQFSDRLLDKSSGIVEILIAK